MCSPTPYDLVLELLMKVHEFLTSLFYATYSTSKCPTTGTSYMHMHIVPYKYLDPLLTLKIPRNPSGTYKLINHSSM